MIIFDPINVPVPLGSVLTASNVPEDDAAVWNSALGAWTIRTSAADVSWRSVAYGNDLFVAVAQDGTTANQIMTSPDGITWTSRTSPSARQWQSVTYGNGLFVAVALDGTTANQIMTSPDGITWTSRTSPFASNWYGVTYGNGLFVAVGLANSPNPVCMTSPDGITWTSRSLGLNSQWRSVIYGNGLFVAVRSNVSDTSNMVATSPDGITWTLRTGAAGLWRSVTYGNGMFVAVASSGTGNRVMTSPDGINWTSRASAADYDWSSVAYNNGLFVAVASTGTGNRVMTSPDGITWTLRASAADNTWYGVAYGNGMFVAVASSGTGNRVMTLNTISYTIGQRVIYTPDKHLYEVLAVNGTSDNPAEGALLVPPTWLDRGPINRWKMFDGAVTLQTSKTVSVDVTIAPGTSVDAVAALNVSGYSVQVIRASTGYNVETVLGAGQTDVVFFLPTAASGPIQVIVWGDAAHTSGTAKIGELLIGLQQTIGESNFGTSIGIVDYSRKEVDTFGNLTIVERRFSKRASYDVTVETLNVASIQGALAAIRATAVVYIGDPARPETVVYGFYKSFNIVLSSHSISDCSIEVEGLT